MNFKKFEEIKKRVLAEEKKYKYCCVEGPRGKAGPTTIKIGKVESVSSFDDANIINSGTDEDLVLDFLIPKGEKGDKGDSGPANIVIGKVETVDADSDAEVVNSGTPVDVVLNFKIPKGKKGDKGEKGDEGPRGLPGEIGRTEHIAIDETETLDAGEPAQVTDTFENWVHHLAFSIPQGAPGPKGEAGTSFVSAYGLRYSTSTTPIAISQGVDTIIMLPLDGPSLFTEYINNNAIKIKENGVYLINYSLCGATNEDCSLTTSVRVNDLLQPATDTTTEFQAQIIGCINGFTIVSLDVNDIVTLNVKASMAVNMTFNGSTSAKLSVIKIH